MPRSHRAFWPGICSIIAGLTSVFAGIYMLASSGCASNPITAAQDSEQRAYAIYGTFVIVEEQGAHVVGSAGVPSAVAQAIKAADARAKPSADALLQAVRDYDNASHELHAGTGTADKLTIASSNLQKWVSQAQTDVAALVNAVKQGS